MDRNTRSSTAAFNKLPIELNKEIAQHLPSDSDIASYRRICRSTNQAIDGDNLSFWRTMYRTKYALLAGKSNRQLKKQYQRRAKYLGVRAQRLNFARGHGSYEKRGLAVLRDLINESFKGTPIVGQHGRPQCLNQLAMSSFIRDSRFLLNSRRPKPPQPNEPSSVHPTMAAVRLMCSHLLFDMDAATWNSVVAMEESQRAVYAPINIDPLYFGPNLNEVNMEWASHCLNFFRYYMMKPDVSSLYDNLQDLAPSERPSAWQAPLKPGSKPLGSYWKGTYAYLEHDQLRRLRALSFSSVDQDHLLWDEA